MDNIKYVYSNGCSFAEGCGLDNPKKERYSKLIADKFGAEDINQSSGGGSNQRIFRTTFEWISENQDKLKNTLFVIQLTYPIRNEIWVNGEHIIKERPPRFYGTISGKINKENIASVIKTGTKSIDISSGLENEMGEISTEKINSLFKYLHNNELLYPQ